MQLALRRYIVATIILFGLTLVLTIQTREIANQHQDNYRTFVSYSRTSSEYQTGLRPAWRPRIFANLPAGLCFKYFYQAANEDIPIFEFSDASIKAYQKTIQTWTFFWFFAIGIIFIVQDVKSSIYYMLGIFAVLHYGYSLEQQRFFPWDLPAVFFYSLVMCLWMHKKFIPAMIGTVIGIGFKETTILLSLLPLATSLPLKKKCIQSGIVLGACFLLKITLDVIAKTPIPFFTPQVSTLDQESSLITKNFHQFKQDWLNLLFLNAGTLLAVFFTRILKVNQILIIVVVIFTLSLLFFGIIKEYRIFFEAAPLCLKCIWDLMFNEEAGDINRDEIVAN